jgi:polyene glycosyltransferase
LSSSAEISDGQRILFASDTGWGHVNPLVTLADELAKRGIGDIWITTTDVHKAAIEANLSGQPVRFASLGPSNPENEPENWSDKTLRGMTTRSPLRNFLRVMENSVDHGYRRQQYLRVLEVIDELRPDLAVVDMSSYGIIDALSTRGVPYIAVVPAIVSHLYTGRLPWSYPTPFSGLPRHMSPLQKVRNVAFRAGIQAAVWHPRQLRANIQFFMARKAEGLANPASVPALYADGAVALLAYFDFDFEYPFFPGAPDNLKMLGAVIPHDLGAVDPDPDLDQWLDSHESVVYVGFGTVMRPSPRQVQAIVDAAARIGPGHHVLWKLSRSQQHLLPGRLPSNLRVESWVPSQFAVLAHPHVRAFFHHGGANSVQEGLYFGTPQLVMPFWMDNLDNAARVTDSGTGLAVSRFPRGRDISARLTRLLGEPRFAERAADWSRRLHESDGISVATEEIIAALKR